MAAPDSTTAHQAAPPCTAPAHHWRIATPAGPTTRGTCLHCGAERVFATTLPDTDWKPGVGTARRRFDDWAPLNNLYDIGERRQR